MTPQESLHLYLRHKIAENLRSGSLINIRRDLSRFIRDSKIQSIEQISQENITHHQIRLLKTQKAITVRGARANIISWHTWLVNEGILIDRDLHTRVPRIRCEETLPKFLTPDQCRRFLLTAQIMPHHTRLAEKRDYAMLLTLIDTGVRVGELCSIRLADLDLPGHTIRVDQASKSRKERYVVFGPSTASALRAYLRVRGQNASEYLFVTRDTQKPTRGLILAIVKRIGRAAGMCWVTVHAMRHTCITSLVRSGLELPLVQQQSGHATIQMVVRYTHLTGEDLKRGYADKSPVEKLSTSSVT